MTSLENFLAAAPPAFLRSVAAALDANAAESRDFRRGLVKGYLLASSVPVPEPPTPTATIATPRRRRARKEFFAPGILPDPDYTDATGGQYLSQAPFARCLGVHPRHLLRWERQGRLTRYRNTENPRDARIYYDFTVVKAFHAQGVEKGLYPAADPSPVG